MKIKSFLLSLILLSCSGINQGCQPIKSVSPPSAATQIINEQGQKIQKVFVESVTEQGIVGATAYIDSPQGTWELGTGIADRKVGRKMASQDRFRIASISKMFVATVVLQLYAEHKLDLEDKLTDWLPQEITDHLPNSDKITIRHLLQHTSGLGDYLDEAFYEAVKARDPKEVWTPEEAIVYGYDLEATGAPGEKHEYSNTNYILLELIVQGVTGHKLEQELRSRIFNPLQLHNTFVEMRENIPGGFVQGYEDLDGDGQRDETRELNFGSGLGDGGIVASAADVGKFVKTLFAQEMLLKDDILEEMLTKVDDGEGDEYGLGVSIWQSDWGEAWGHNGKVEGFLSTVWYLPDQKVTVVVLTNDGDHADPDAIAEDILRELKMDN